jgi:hypothetical protein
MVDQENEMMIAAVAANLRVTEDSLTAINVAPDRRAKLEYARRAVIRRCCDDGVRLGEKRRPTIKAPRILERVEPQCTNEARAAGIEGTVTLDENGPLVVYGLQRLRAWAG